MVWTSGVTSVCRLTSIHSSLASRVATSSSPDPAVVLSMAALVADWRTDRPNDSNWPVGLLSTMYHCLSLRDSDWPDSSIAAWVVPAIKDRLASSARSNHAGPKDSRRCDRASRLSSPRSRTSIPAYGPSGTVGVSCPSACFARASLRNVRSRSWSWTTCCPRRSDSSLSRPTSSATGSSFSRTNPLISTSSFLIVSTSAFGIVVQTSYSCSGPYVASATLLPTLTSLSRVGGALVSARSTFCVDPISAHPPALRARSERSWRASLPRLDPRPPQAPRSDPDGRCPGRFHPSCLGQEPPRVPSRGSPPSCAGGPPSMHRDRLARPRWTTPAARTGESRPPPPSTGTLSTGSQLTDAARRKPLSQAFLTRWAKASSPRNSNSATMWPPAAWVSPSVLPIGSPPEGDLPTTSWAHITTGFFM